MQLTAITLDCADPRTLAAFYQQAMGLELHPGSDDDLAAGHPFCLTRNRSA